MDETTRVVFQREGSAPADLIEERDRLRQLIQAGIALSSELSLDALLTKLAETAARVTRARYAALGVLDPSRTTLERFITVGIDEETRAELGEPPRGRGILGVLIREARPLRLRDLTADPRSVGFPPRHPPMHSFLGVPVLLRGQAYGNLYLTEKEGGAEFTDDDEELVTMLAAQAAVAIDNARLYESATRWLRRLESLNAFAIELASESDMPRLLQLVADSLRELIGARIVTVWLAGPHGSLQLEAAAGEWPRDDPSLQRASNDQKLLRVFARGQPERIDSLLEDPEVSQQTARKLGLKTGLWNPLVVQGRPVGIVAAYDKLGPDPRFLDDDMRIAEALAARAASAVDLRQRISAESVRSMLAAQEEERKRMARELHDQTGQALVSIQLALKPLEARAGAEAVEPVRELVADALADVRRLAVQLRPSLLDDFGLVAALERLGESLRDQGGPAVELETDLSEGERLPDEVETALYRIAQEALTNVVKHARASRARVRMTRGDRSLTLTIEDDGRGFSVESVPEGRFGLLGIRERVALLAGNVSLRSAPGNGTCVTVELPLH
jgi:signal transduction histidine kinase